MTRAPIEPRALAATVWTGTEVVVIGGQSGRGEILRDAAASNPRTNTGRVLPDAPVDVRGSGAAVWTGREVAVFDVESTEITEVLRGDLHSLGFDPVALDPVTGVWRSLPRPPLFVRVVTVAGGRVVALAGDDDLERTGRSSWIWPRRNGGWRRGRPLPVSTSS